jgi:outer membrane protein assembly factor BamB
MKTQLFVALAVVAGTYTSHAGDWPQFRGPGSAGVSDETGLPTHWAPTTNIQWKVAIPGVAWSSPIVSGDRVFVTTAVSDADQESPKKGLYFGGDRSRPPDATFRWELLCLDRDEGSIVWRRVAKQAKPTTPIHLKNSYASETPVTDGERVYAWFGAAGLFAYDLDGEVVWQKDLGAFPTRLGWGTASSPAIDGDRLFVQCDNEERSFLVAFNKKTGEELWRVDRDEKSSWSTPLVWKNERRTELVTSATKRVRSYDPASGKLLWELSGMSVIACPTPVAGRDLLYVSSGYVLDARRPLFAVRPGASGDITLADNESSNAGVAWRQKLGGPYNPSPLVYGGLVYVLYDRGFFACFEADSGKPVYDRQRIEPGAGGFTASPWAYDGKIFCLNEDGDTFVIQAGREFKLLGKNSLDEMCMASPAIAHGSLFLRGIQHVYCIRASTTAAKPAP